MTRTNPKFENKLPSIFRLPIIKGNPDGSYKIDHKSFKDRDTAKEYGANEITHVYGNKASSINYHEYTYRGFIIHNFDRPSNDASDHKDQFFMVDQMDRNPLTMFHGERESLALALDYIDSYLYKVCIGRIKVDRGTINPEASKYYNKKYIIIHTDKCGTRYLAWQNPAWDESGYFWTSRKTFIKVLRNSTTDHPFLFNSRREACTWLRLSGINLRCKIATIKISKSTKLNDPDLGATYPGISADMM